jgi:hypothetical protein
LFFFPTALGAQSGPAVTSTGTLLPTYRAFSRQAQYLQTPAQTVASPAAAQLHAWHQQHIGLTAQKATELKQVAATHVAEIGGIEAA